MNNSLSPDSRIWIYQAERPLTDAEADFCNKHLQAFVPGWTAHNQQLKADFEILYNRFIVLCVDESQAGASGCSIDKSVREIKHLGDALNINFFNRLQLAWLDKDDSVKSGSREEIQQLFKQGSINEDTTVFNNMVSNLEAYRRNWKIPYSRSWAF